MNKIRTGSKIIKHVTYSRAFQRVCFLLVACIAIIAVFSTVHCKNERDEVVHYISSQTNAMYQSTANAVSNLLTAFDLGDYERFEANYKEYLSCLTQAKFSLSLTLYCTDFHEKYPNAVRALYAIYDNEMDVASPKELFVAFPWDQYSEIAILLQTGQDSLESRLMAIENDQNN